MVLFIHIHIKKKKSKDTISQWFMEIKTLKRILLKVANWIWGVKMAEE